MLSQNLNPILIPLDVLNTINGVFPKNSRPISLFRFLVLVLVLEIESGLLIIKTVV